MTEDEAKTKWCPFARGYVGGGAGYAAINREKKEGEKPRCIASACMAWRWDWIQNPREGAPPVIPSPTSGQCGLTR